MVLVATCIGTTSAAARFRDLWQAAPLSVGSRMPHAALSGFGTPPLSQRAEGSGGLGA